MDLLQEIRKGLSLKHTGIKQELYSALIQETHADHIQQEISQIKTDIQLLKESMNTPHHQYAVPLQTNPVTLQQQLSKMKEDIKHLQQMKCPNVYPIPPGNYRSFQTADGLVICRRCNQVGHFQHSRVTRITDATIYPLPPHNTHGHCTPPINPPINIFAVVPIDQMTLDTVLWNILTHHMPSIPIPHRDHLSTPIISIIYTHHPCTHPLHTIHTYASLFPPTNTIMSLILHQ